MITKGTAYTVGKGLWRVYVAYDDMAEGRCSSFVQIRPTDDPRIWREYGPVRRLRLDRAVLLGQRFESGGYEVYYATGQSDRLWYRQPKELP